MSIYCYFGRKRGTLGRSSQPSPCLSWLNYRDYSDVKNDVIPKTVEFTHWKLRFLSIRSSLSWAIQHFFLTLKPWKLIMWRRICSWVQLPRILFNLLPFVLHLVDQFEVKNHLFIVVIVMKNIHLHVYTWVLHKFPWAIPPFFHFKPRHLWLGRGG